jgi:hypothetical protein
MGLNHLNWDQHRLTERMVHGVDMPKDMREILMRAVQGGHPMILQKTAKNHTVVHIKDDGSVVSAGTGGRGRGNKNFESQLRRNLRSVGADMPRKGESMKQFIKRRQPKENPTEQPENPTEQPEVSDPTDNS